VPSGPHTLSYRPRAQRVEHARSASLSADDSESFVIRRTLGPDLAFTTSHARVGAELLPEGDRPAYGGSVLLLWAPILPSRCLFTARDARGTYRILPAPKSETLARTLERLEVECARAFEEALAECPYPAQVVRHLDAALEQAAVAVLLFGDAAPGRPFWQRAAS